MVDSVILIFFYVVSPFFLIHLCNSFPVLNKIGVILLAYAVGLVLGNTGILPENSPQIQDTLTTITVPIAIPLLLFSIDVKQWFKIAGKTFLSMALAIGSLLLVIFLGYLIFRSDLENVWQVSGMLVGVYTGGTPNLASIKTGLGADSELFIVINAYDVIISAVFLFFLMSVAQRLFLKFLPSFSLAAEKDDLQGNKNIMQAEDISSYYGIFRKPNVLPLAAALGIAVLILATGGGVSMLVPEKISMAVAILLITTIGIGASFVPAVNKIRYTFQLGMYFILIFSIVVASMADIGKLMNIPPALLYYITLAVFGTLVLHLLLAKLFKIDADTVIITATALVCSPPFVPVIAGALRNKHIIISGLTIGIIGYAIGNYLGISFAYLLR